MLWVRIVTEGCRVISREQPHATGPVIGGSDVRLGCLLNPDRITQRVVGLALRLASVMLILSSSFPAFSSEFSSAANDSSTQFAAYKINPYQYLYGNVVKATVVRSGRQSFTTVEVKPVRTYLMFSQDVIFCGDQRDKFDATALSPVVLVYSRVMHNRGCFELVLVDVVD